MKDKILRYWTYFRRGHGTYLAFLMSFANFMVIQYRLLVQYVPFLDAIFSSLTAFIIAFVLVYLPAACIIGWLDYKKFAFPMDSIIANRASPFSRDLAKSLMLMCDGKSEEVKEIMRKWVEFDANV